MEDCTMYTSLLNFPGGLFADFDRMRREMDSLFGLAGPAQGIRAVTEGSYPAINVGNTPQSVEVFAFAPGIDASKVDVTLDRGVLTISGERALDLPTDESKGSVYGQERLAGRFRRAVSLPDDIDAGKVNASYRDGVLRVSIARREAVQPKRITIE
jgi:HSP20 family protein